MLTHNNYPISDYHEENQMQVTLPTLSNIPQFSNMLSSYLRSEGESPRKHWIAVFEYPDCVREFDGKKWSVVLDKRIQE